MLPESIDQAQELLYGHELASFVAERDALVKQIRAGGDRDLANSVKALRKPSRIAADVNQIVRADPAGIDLLLQAAALLRSAQTGALEGSTIDASQLQQHYRAAIRALSQSATSRQAEVRSALEAATIDESSNDALRSGCLVVIPTPVSLFGSVSIPISPAVPATAPVDELEARRARRRSSKAKKQSATNTDAAATEAAALKAEAAAEKKRAAEAEAQRKSDERERLRKLKSLKKAHREAVRSHLAALDAEETAATDVDDADQMLIEIDEEQQALEQAIIDLQTRRHEATESRSLADQSKTQANERAEQAEAEVDALADAISAIEDA